MGNFDSSGAGLLQFGFRLAFRPGPRVAEPERGQDMTSAGSGPLLRTLNLIKISSGDSLAYSTIDIEVAVLVKDARIEQFIFEIISIARTVRVTRSV